MRKPPQDSPKPAPDIPTLVTADEVAKPLGVTGRTVLNWAAAETIPTALRCGKIIRFHPPSVAAALGIRLPEFGGAEDSSPSNDSRLSHNGRDQTLRRD